MKTYLVHRALLAMTGLSCASVLGFRADSGPPLAHCGLVFEQFERNACQPMERTNGRLADGSR